MVKRCRCTNSTFNVQLNASETALSSTTPIAGAIGSYDSEACKKAGQQSALDMLQQTSPQGPGYCTLAALASDNPGYEDKYVYGTTNEGAPRPKHVILSVGSC